MGTKVERFLAIEAKERKIAATVLGNKTRHVDESPGAQKIAQLGKDESLGRKIMEDLEVLIREDNIDPIIAEMARGEALQQIQEPFYTVKGCLQSAYDEFKYNKYDEPPPMDDDCFIEQDEDGGEADEEALEVNSAPHLTSTQKAIIALDIENQTKESEKRKREEELESRTKAAKIVGTNRQYISDAKKVEATAPEVAEVAKTVS